MAAHFITDEPLHTVIVYLPGQTDQRVQVTQLAGPPKAAISYAMDIVEELGKHSRESWLARVVDVQPITDVFLTPETKEST